jgi:hypothetical protein
MSKEGLNNPAVEQDLNKRESSFGQEMSEEDLAKYFDQPVQATEPKEVPKEPDFSTLEKIKEFEDAQDNSTDIYKIAARVKNLARGPGISLTPQGEMLANTYTHILKSFYDFAEKIEDKKIKQELIELIRSKEGMPGDLIAAAGVGVNKKRSKK